MNKIIVLERKTRDQIAAGEVAERPALIIKELIENAIDAKATDIQIRLKESGIKEIRILDNGSGIEKDDIPYAFLRHATSKITSIEDLDSLYTMGFRGEALASIAAVAKVDLTTKTEEEEHAWSCHVDAGNLSDIIPAAGNKGTEITVSDLFYNTPARKKFLATPVREMREICDIAGRIIIAYPDIRFSLHNDNKQIFLSPGNGDPHTAIAAVYGRDILKFLIPLKENDWFDGFIAHPNYSKPNRNYFHFYINHRYIQSGELNKALENAYKTMLPERRFPVAFINIGLCPDQYDINVHPNKLDIKFHRDIPVADRLFRTIKETLEEVNPTYTTNIPSGGETYSELKEDIIPDKPSIHQNLKPVGLPGAVEMKRRAESFADDPDLLRAELRGVMRGKASPLKQNDFKPQGAKEKFQLKDQTTIQSVRQLFAADSPEAANTDSVFKNNIEAEKNDFPFKVKAEDQSLDFGEGFYSSLRILGQVAGSFIAACNDSALYLIDQHAAHERLLFNKIKKSISEKDPIREPLLIPLEIDLNHRQFHWVIENILVLNQMGFVLEEFGENVFILREAPVWIKDIDEVTFIKEFADGWLDSEKKLSIDTVLERKIMSKACKRAVKANQHLTNADILYLFKELDRAEDGFTCPHGRPISIKFSINEIRRMFLRT